MGFEMPVDVDYFDHPKTLQLIALTGNKEADAFPPRLWRWCAKYAKDGVIEGGAPAIEAACRWRGAPGKLHAALITANFVNPDGITIHDWMEGIGRAIAIYDAKKRKQREKYDRDKGILPEECGKTSGSIPPTLEGRGNSGDSGYSGGDTKTPPAPPVLAEPADQDIIDAVHRRDVTFPVREIQGQITRAVRLGVSKAQLLKDIGTMGERMTIWAIVDLYQYPKGKGKNGNHVEGVRDNATAYSKTDRPPVLDERREDVHKRQDEARAKCDEILEAMDPDEHDGWTRDAEAEADKAGAKSGPARITLVKSILRSRVAKENGIEGI